MTELRRKKVLNDITTHPEKPLKHALIDAGYSPSYAHNPNDFRNTEAVKVEYKDRFPDNELIKVHKGLLDAKYLDHMVFPLFNLNPKEKEDVGEKNGEQLTDQGIIDLLASVNCTVRRITHGENYQIYSQGQWLLILLAHYWQYLH